MQKSILSPKCISPVPKSLSPGVNLRLYHHSTETETHIYFISKMAKSFDLLGFSRQKADCLHMRGKLLLILSSETVTFCENVCITIRKIAFTPSNQLSYTTSFSPNHSAFKREAKSVPYVPDSNRLSSPSFLYLRL